MLEQKQTVKGAEPPGVQIGRRPVVGYSIAHITQAPSLCARYLLVAPSLEPTNGSDVCDRNDRDFAV